MSSFVPKKNLHIYKKNCFFKFNKEKITYKNAKKNVYKDII